MEKSNILILGSLALATIFGIFGQGIAYFMNDFIASIAPVYYLTGLTFTSVFLYLVSAVITYVAGKKDMLGKLETDIYFPIIGLLGIGTSLWSLFVLAMWWG
ncbi:hypothetical protein AEA09_00400 [Lysinibacillus contaminans]|uniref:Uncharacterized protein n=1 Tax=Lysinibacillus contaminans TaxID=1293441 RepID=A0ABR5K504_9BACI|nr:hypothetical protein [Lysinibacillus contaminans]KOS71507.1 hypothetical protein AEA09_00400 [Lysinibacillus contaminans]